MMTLVGLVLLPAARAPAHAPPTERLRIVSEELRVRPGAPELLVHRAALWLDLGETERAADDLDEALRRAPGLTAARRERARLALATGDPAAALAAADRYVAAEPEDPAGWTIRGRALARLDRPEDAARDLHRALALDPAPEPALYLERARLLAERSPDAALAALDEGQTRLGVLVSLQWPAIEWELARGRPDAALARLDTLLPWYDRRETWLAARGDVLRRAGRFLEAQAAYTEAWEAVASLPAARRDDAATRELRARLESAMRARGGER